MATDHRIDLVFEDQYLAVVNKPHGLQCEPDKNGHPDLCNLLRQHLNRSNKPSKLLQPVNRLDRPVGGLVLFAKTATALRELNKQQETRLIQKTYEAKVQGIVHPPQGTLRHHLYKDLLNQKAVVYAEPRENTKPCVLDYATLAQESGWSRLEIDLKTGRYHQIRAQLAFVGNPVWGDVYYGADTTFLPDAICLFASRLRLQHPISHAALVFDAAPSF